MNKIPNITSYDLKNNPDQTSYTLNRLIEKVNSTEVTEQSGSGQSSNIEVVQQTGTSTTKVMSQNAVTGYLNTKVDKVGGKGLSENDFTDALKTKLENLDPQGEENVIEKVQKNGIDLPISNKTVNVTVPTSVSQLTNDSNFQTASQVASSISAHNSDTTAHPDLRTRVATIEGEIPNQASSSNQLADKNFVNSSINSVTAYYITKDAAGNQFATKAELNSATTFYSGGEVRVPTRNDYCIVLSDESRTDPGTGVSPTTRYIYQNNQWEFQYVVNQTAFTAAQLAALNSGITASGVTKLGGIEDGAQVNAPNTVVDAAYVHTDNNYTNADKTKLDNIPTFGALASKDTVETGDIDDSAVTTAKIDDGAVTADKLSTSYIPTAGGDVSGQLHFTNAGGQQENSAIYLENSTPATDTMTYYKRTDTGTEMGVGIGTGGIDHGIWSKNLNDWLVYADASKGHLNGSAYFTAGETYVLQNVTVFMHTNSAGTTAYLQIILPKRVNKVSVAVSGSTGTSTHGYSMKGVFSSMIRISSYGAVTKRNDYQVQVVVKLSATVTDYAPIIMYSNNITLTFS